MADPTTASWLQQASEWISILQPIVWGFFLWGWWSLKKIFVQQKDCKECRDTLEEKQIFLGKRQDGDKARQDALETALQNLPTGKDMQSILLGLSELRGNMQGLAEKVDGQGRSLARVEKSVDLLTEVHMGDRK